MQALSVPTRLADWVAIARSSIALVMGSGPSTRQVLLLLCVLAGCAVRAPRPDVMAPPAELPEATVKRLISVWEQQLARYIDREGGGDPAVLSRTQVLHSRDGATAGANHVRCPGCRRPMFRVAMDGTPRPAGRQTDERHAQLVCLRRRDRGTQRLSSLGDPGHAGGRILDAGRKASLADEPGGAASCATLSRHLRCIWNGPISGRHRWVQHERRGRAAVGTGGTIRRHLGAPTKRGKFRLKPSRG